MCPKYKDNLNWTKEIKLRVHTVSPGLVDTVMTKDLEDETIKTSVDTIASYVCWVLDPTERHRNYGFIRVRTKPVEDNGMRYSDYRKN